MASSEIAKVSAEVEEAGKQLDVARICQHHTEDTKFMPPGSLLVDGVKG